MSMKRLSNLPLSQRPTGLTRADVRPASQARVVSPTAADARVQVRTIGVRMPQAPEQPVMTLTNSPLNGKAFNACCCERGLPSADLKLAATSSGGPEILA